MGININRIEMKVIFAVMGPNGKGFSHKKEFENYKFSIPRKGETMILNDFAFEITRVEWYVDDKSVWVIAD